MAQSVLIIGEDPAGIDFDAPGAPPGMTADTVIDGLEGARDRLRDAGYVAEILLLAGDGVEAQAKAALARHRWDVVVVGAGLRTLPPMADRFERLMNVLHRDAPGAALAFNARPDDSDAAARRWLERG